MTIFLLQTLCSFLIAMSLVFIVIQIRAKFDKSFLIFGISNLLLCSFSAIDIWLQPTGQVLHWTRLQHVIASFFMPFLTWHIMLLTNSENMNIIRFMNLLSAFLSLLFITNLMLVPSDIEVTSTLLYKLLFVPYLIITIVVLLYTVFKKVSKSTSYQKQVLWYHLIGGAALSMSGILDLVILINGKRLIPEIPNFSIVGVLSFSLAVTIVFTNRLAGLIAEREIVFKKLCAAYHDLEDVQALKELGQSTAMINHEIRNYATAITGYAEMLRMHEDLDTFSFKMANRITDAAVRMTNFSKEILEFSKSKVLESKVPFEFCAFVKACIDNNFYKESHRFKIVDEKNNISEKINGDWQKLDQAFVNMFKNSIEAGANNITITIASNESTLFCKIEDDGVGCSDLVLKDFFKAFRTTKKETGGTGLGMCVVRSIVEGHGGRISVFTRNNTNLQTHGLGLNVVLPKYTDETVLNNDYKNNIIFITEGIKDLSYPIQVFRNTLLNPYLYKTVKEIDSALVVKDEHLFFIATIENVEQFRNRFNFQMTIFVLLPDSGSGLFIVDEKGENDPVKFSEEFLLSHFNNIIAKNVA